jgi:hypothetical protein
VQTHDFLDDIEPNSHAAHVLLVAVASTVKALKEMRNVFGGNADASICHDNTSCAASLLNLHPHRPACQAIFHPVANQIL